MGPIGTFFTRVAKHLESQGVQVYKLSLPLREPGFRNDQKIRFAGDFNLQFKDFLATVIEEKQIRHIFMYGDFIWPHRIAIELTRERNNKGHQLESWVFELGYLRPNYVTLEPNRVNCRSNLNQPASFYRELPPVETLPEAKREAGLRWRKAWKAPTFIQHALTRYRICEGEHKLQPKPSYVLAQVRGFFRKYKYAISERSIKQQLWNGQPFFLVILQVATDSQLKHGSPYRDIGEFVGTTLVSFAVHSEKHHRLFIKHHPRDRGYKNYSQLIKQACQQLGIEDRVFYFHDSPLSPIFRNPSCQGCILINSSVGFQALYHNVPLKALGSSPYNIQGLSDQQSLGDFWSNPTACDRELFKKFYQYTIDKTQINGNFDGYFPFHETFRVLPRAQTIEQAAKRDRSPLHRPLTLIQRLGQLVLAYAHYTLHWLAYGLGKTHLGRSLFEQSAQRCLHALGATVIMERSDARLANRAELHIGNHESALDVLLVHGFFKMPAATTAQLHLRFLIPGFRYAATRYGHHLLNYKCPQSRTSTLRKSNSTLKRNGRLFIFPSGSLKTSIEERFSTSIAFLARENDAVIYPWTIRYQSKEAGKSQQEFRNPLRLLLDRLSGDSILIVCSQHQPFDSRDYATNQALTEALHAIYKGDARQESLSATHRASRSDVARG